MSESVFVARGIPTGQTQVGYAGLPTQVLQQRMSDLEGHAVALRWVATIRPETNTGRMRQPMWPLCVPLFPRMEVRELPPSRREDTESVRRLPKIALPDKSALMETPNVEFSGGAPLFGAASAGTKG